MDQFPIFVTDFLRMRKTYSQVADDREENIKIIIPCQS